MPELTEPPPASPAYFMDHPREGERLAAKVDATAWVDQRLGLRPDFAGNLLDVGCGSGAILIEAAGRSPLASAVGIDLSPSRAADARHRAEAAGLKNVSVHEASASALPLDNDCIDLAWCRFLLEYLPDPLAAVRELVRVSRPGGRVVLEDLDGQLVWHDNASPALQAGLEEALAALAETGFDPLTGRRLFGWARAVGLTDLHVAIEAYHLYAGRIPDHEAALWRLKLDIAAEGLAPRLGEARARRIAELFWDHLHDPDTLTYSNVVTVSGMKPVTAVASH